jgi:ribonuclease J
MRVCIHRGSAEVGGSCVEVAVDGSRLVIDLGVPLESPMGAQKLLPPTVHLDHESKDLAGILVSHGHPDHWGLLGCIDPAVPVYVGAVTADVLRQAAFFGPISTEVTPTEVFRAGQEMTIGAFRVTPHLVDHSAADSYAFEIEAAGRRLLYSGDLRAHGRRGDLVRDLPALLGGHVDALLLEGTTVGRPFGAINSLTEFDVENQCASLFRRTPGIVLAAYSPQNVDRLISLYRASRAAGRTLVLDLYAATMAAASANPDAPRWNSPGIRVYVPQAQRVKVKTNRAFDRVREISTRRIYPEQLAADADTLVLTFRSSMASEIARAVPLEAAALLWSMWPGYLDRIDGQRLKTWLDNHHVSLEVIHSSGHATVEDLQCLAAGIAPTALVPIHTAAPNRFDSFFDNVKRHGDGDWWPV